MVFDDHQVRGLECRIDGTSRIGDDDLSTAQTRRDPDRTGDLFGRQSLIDMESAAEDEKACSTERPLDKDVPMSLDGRYRKSRNFLIGDGNRVIQDISEPILA